MPIGATGYKNLSNQWIWIYSQGAVTMKDDSGNTVKVTTMPCWVPPNWTVNTGVSTDIIFGLQGDISEFAGFLSRVANAAVGGVSSIGATVGIVSLSALEREFETVSNGLGGGLAKSYTETEVATHN